MRYYGDGPRSVEGLNEMRNVEALRRPSLVVSGTQPLIGIFAHEHGRDVVRYFVDEADADAAIPPTATQAALAAIGAWRDLDWEQTIDALDRLRHESTPTPPIDDL